MRTSQIVRAIVCVASFVLSASAAADVFDVTGQVVSEDGAPLEGVRVTVNGKSLAVDADGEFSFPVDRRLPELHRIGVASDGYYPALQTVHRSDFVAGIAATMPAIELVKKVAGRRLLMFGGDAMLSRRYFEPRAGEPALARAGTLAADARALLQHVRPYIELADIASVNMETQLSAEPLLTPLAKSVTFYSPPELAEALQWAGVDYVALGNNHMFDFQRPGLDTTLAILDDLKLAYSGAGHNDEQARKATFVSLGNEHYGFLSYVGWAGTFKPSQVAEPDKGGAALGDAASIAEDLKKIPAGTTSVVQLHSGIEYAAMPSLSEQTTLQNAVRAGGDIVIGHHPHVLQGLDIVDDRLIAYSLGNFLFDQYIYSTQMSMLLFVWMDGEELHRAEAVPMQLNGYVPTPATGQFRHAILHRLAKLSNPRNVCLRSSGLHLVAEGCEENNLSRAQRLEVSKTAMPFALRNLGASPLYPVSIDGATSPYRLGVDLLRRGDFEYAGLFETTDRTWIENKQVRLVNGEATHLAVSVARGETVAQTGLKVFDRVFTLSNPATVSGRIRLSGDARLKVSLQRRRSTDSFSAGLVDGPVSDIGEATFSGDGWHEFSFDYSQPRLSSRAVRFLIEVEDSSGNGVEALIDDMAWVEWRTPWRQPGDTEPAMHATHIQFQQ